MTSSTARTIPNPLANYPVEIQIVLYGWLLSTAGLPVSFGASAVGYIGFPIIALVVFIVRRFLL